jgi:hypothetical protein
MSIEGDTSQLSGLEKFYRDNFVIGIILSICCNIVGLVLSVVTYLQAKDPKAKNNAMICMIIAIVDIAIGIGINFLGGFAHFAGR